MQSMNSATNPVYWYTNQVIITYYSSIELKLDDRAFHQAVKDTIAGCERDIQQDILKDTYTLHRDTTKNTALAGNDGSDDLSGIYIYQGIIPLLFLLSPTALVSIREKCQPRRTWRQCLEMGEQAI